MDLQTAFRALNNKILSKIILLLLNFFIWVAYFLKHYTQHKNLCSKDHEFNNLDRGFFADHYLTFSLLLHAPEKNSLIKIGPVLEKLLKPKGKLILISHLPSLGEGSRIIMILQIGYA